MRTMTENAVRSARIRTPRDRSSRRGGDHGLARLRRAAAPGVQRVDPGEDRALDERPRPSRRGERDGQPDEWAKGDEHVLVPQVQRVRRTTGEAERPPE